MNPEKGEALAEIKKHHVEQLPIFPINVDNKREKEIYDKIVGLVNQILMLNTHLKDLKDKEFEKKIKKEIQNIEPKIDDLVDDLYGITDREKKIIEESLK